MHAIPNIITERVDDMPLLIEQMQRMSLPTLLDTHFPTYGNWTGLSLGWVSTIWLSSIVSRGDHRMVHVEPWVSQRLSTLGATTGQTVTRVDFTDDRLEIVLRRLSEDTWWAAFESALNQQTVRVYDVAPARVHVDSTSASVYATVSEGGLFQFGHSKGHRPDLPQVKVMQAVLDPLGMPLATDVVSGERADDPLYLPCIERVQASLGRHGLLYVGTARWRRVTRAPASPPRAIFTCVLDESVIDSYRSVNSAAVSRRDWSTPQYKKTTRKSCWGVFTFFARTKALNSRAIAIVSGGRSCNRSSNRVSGSVGGICMVDSLWFEETMAPCSMPFMSMLYPLSWRLWGLGVVFSVEGVVRRTKWGPRAGVIATRQCP
jgi:hypothetical protein